MLLATLNRSALSRNDIAAHATLPLKALFAVVTNCPSSMLGGDLSHTEQDRAASLGFTRLLFVLDRVVVRHFALLSCVTLLANFLLACLVIAKVPYTEIDWEAYMEEVSGVLNDKQFDYKLLQGGTGPLVYPAGFVYIYSALYYVTLGGTSIRAAQYIFALLHTAVLGLVFYIYRRCYRVSAPSFPIVIVFLLPLSRRVMSLFVLRMFNDGVQVLFMYAAIAAFVDNRWNLGCFLYSLSVSVKMNALLFAPGVAVLLCQAKGFRGAMWRIAVYCAGVQIVVGAPFLAHAPVSYISRAFEFTRVFFHKWSVNGACLEEEHFLDRRLAVALLAGHLFALLLFGHLRWTFPKSGGLFGLLKGCSYEQAGTRTVSQRPDACLHKLLPLHIVQVLFTSNFVGIVFARTLHFQFYLWYMHTIPMLVSMSSLPVALKMLIPAVIEIVFNIFPPHRAAALGLHACHALVLFGLWNRAPASERTAVVSQNESASAVKSKAR